MKTPRSAKLSAEKQCRNGQAVVADDADAGDRKEDSDMLTIRHLVALTAALMAAVTAVHALIAMGGSRLILTA